MGTHSRHSSTAHRLRWRLGLVIWVLLAGAGAVQAETLRIRLVRASNSAGGADPALQDVLLAMRGSLVFQSYALAGQKQLPLPANGIVALGSFQVTCTGPRQKLAIVIRRGSQRLMQTTASLKGGKPLLLGGFPDGANQMILVFTAE